MQSSIYKPDNSLSFFFLIDSILIQQRFIMGEFSRLICIVAIVALASASYLEFQLVRTAIKDKEAKLQAVNCLDQASLNQDAEYREICYQKDIGYVIPFIKNGENRQHFSLAADFTTPISWIKGPHCIIAGSKHKCTRLTETVAEKFVAKKAKMLGKNKAESENAIIEGSSQIIRGEIENGVSLSFVTKDSNRLNNFFQLMLLGLFIYGERDTLLLEKTNFINAISISSHLSSLMDGAISLRFDETAERSFLDQIFDYVKTVDKTVTIFLGSNNTMTIGDMTAKFTKSGYSSINWFDMPDDQGYGKLAQISNIAVEDTTDDVEDDTDETLPAIITLSASYIGLPEQVINSVLIQSFNKSASCKIDSKTLFVECSSSNKKKIEKIIAKNLIFGFGGPNMMIPMEKLVLKNDHGKRVVFNIKKTYNRRIILGEPIFLEHFMAFDYQKNRIGFGPKRQNFGGFFIGVVSLVRFMSVVFALGCSFILCYIPCQKWIKKLRSRGDEYSQGKGLRQYSAIQQNPYDDLKGKIHDVLNSSEEEQD